MLKRFSQWLLETLGTRLLSPALSTRVFFSVLVFTDKLYHKRVESSSKSSQTSRSSLPVVFCKKDDLKNFSKFTGKHLYQTLSFFTRVFLPVNFTKFLRRRFFIKNPPLLLLDIFDDCFITLSLISKSIMFSKILVTFTEKDG